MEKGIFSDLKEQALNAIRGKGFKTDQAVWADSMGKEVVRLRGRDAQGVEQVIEFPIPNVLGMGRLDEIGEPGGTSVAALSDWIAEVRAAAEWSREARDAYLANEKVPHLPPRGSDEWKDRVTRAGVEMSGASIDLWIRAYMLFMNEVKKNGQQTTGGEMAKLQETLGRWQSHSQKPSAEGSSGTSSE